MLIHINVGKVLCWIVGNECAPFFIFFFSYDKADTNLGTRISLQAVQYILPEKQCDTPWNEMMTKKW